jgi:hypothetical protein
LNTWDDGTEGNYWCSPQVFQLEHPDAKPIGNIWDTPYEIDANNTDNYPLVNQYVIPEFPIFFILPLFMLAISLAVIVYTRKNKIGDVM